MTTPVKCLYASLFIIYELCGQSKWENGNTKRREGSYLQGWHVTKFLTKSCMFAYEWQYRTMITCTILIVNIPTEQE